jgi:hypothetical protein
VEIKGRRQSFSDDRHERKRLSCKRTVLDVSKHVHDVGRLGPVRNLVNIEVPMAGEVFHVVLIPKRARGMAGSEGKRGVISAWLEDKIRKRGGKGRGDELMVPESRELSVAAGLSVVLSGRLSGRIVTI